MASSVCAWLMIIAVVQLPPTPAPTSAEVAATIARLGDERFSTRELATEQLWQWGDAAEPALQAALKHADPEIRIRAKSVLDRFNLGLYADTPPDSAAAIRQYRSGQQAQKIAAIERLKSLQDWRTLMRLQRTEADVGVRNQITMALRGDLLKRVAAQIETGDLAAAEALLRSDPAAGDSLAHTQLATLYLLRGDLKERITELETELRDVASDPRQRLLLNLYDADKNYASANELRVKLSGKNLPPLINAAVQQHDWKQAAEHFDTMLATTPVHNFDQLAYSSMYHRLAGNGKAADEKLAALRKVATPQQAWFLLEILLLHERLDEALEGLKTTRPTMAFEIYCMRHEFEKAFAIADVRVGRTYDEAWFDALPAGDIAAADPEQQVNRRHILALQAAYFLHQLGEKKDAEAIFLLLRGLDRPGSVNSARWRRGELCRIQLRLGLDDEAFRDAEEYAAGKADAGIVTILFARQGPIAGQWFQILAAQLPGESVSDHLTKVRLLIRPSRAQKKDESWRALVDAALASLPEEKAAPRFQRVEVIAEAYLAHGQRQAAIDLLSRDNLNSLLYLRGGDLLREDKQYAAASTVYGKIGSTEIHRAIGLYLQGVCEGELGNADSSQLLKQRAVLLSADNSARTLLFNGMATRRLTKEAAYLRDLWTRTSPELNATLAKEYGDAAADSDPALAADQWDSVLVRLTSTSASLTEDAGYIVLTHAIHRARLKAAIAAGKKDDFQRELDACLRLLPQAWEMIDDIVPKMDAAGWKAEADALFDEQYARLTALAKKHPSSPRLSNAVAWISASCHRHLDEALVQAEHTMQLAPDNPSYLDTLAEVHFARGNIDKAIETQRRVVELSPLPLFKERLEKFEAAKP
ncbi:MAG TPA: hypothetical protein VM915_14440 [Verrucomicrobiae bacterium]|nr:hypothetical protein [Verrucomicrobiae bacterium]